MVAVVWAVLSFGLPRMAYSQPQEEGQGVLVRVNGDVNIGKEAENTVVVVVNGDLTLARAAKVVVVVNGTATLSGADVAEVVAVNGTVRLQDSTVIQNNLNLINATLDRGKGSRIGGMTRRDTGVQWGRGLFVFGILFSIGYGIAVILSGLVAAAVAPSGLREAGRLMTDEVGPALLAAIGVWFGLPIVAVVALATLVGIPFGLGVLFFLLPALAFLGYLTTGIRIGDLAVEALRGQPEPSHPYLAAVIGLILLVLATWIPVLGMLVAALAMLMGAGGLVLTAWRLAQNAGTSA